jgi:hypothetical protein
LAVLSRFTALFDRHQSDNGNILVGIVRYWGLPVPRAGHPNGDIDAEECATVNPEHLGSADAPSLEARRQAYEGVRALLSDDHNYELGLFALQDVIDRVAEQQGTEMLAAMTFEMALKLAQAFERIASDEGLAAVDLLDVWFAD